MTEVTIPKYEPIPEGIYVASIESVEEVENNFEAGKMQFKYLLNIEHDQAGDKAHAGRKQFVYAPTQGRKNVAIYNAAMDEKIEAGKEEFTFNTDDLVGRKLVIVVKIGQKKDGTPTNKVESMLVFKNAPQATQEPEPVHEPDNSEPTLEDVQGQG